MTSKKKQMPEHRVYKGMVSRCHNPKDKDYPYYGARGITVCGSWRGIGGFDRFIEHIGLRPSSEHTIDRIDNSKGYQPNNVRWTTWQVQQNNRRSNHYITIDCETRSAADWARITKLPRRQTITNRLQHGWHPTVAVMAPFGTDKDTAHKHLEIDPTWETVHGPNSLSATAANDNGSKPKRRKAA